jgi:hypothetical protein
MLQLQGKAPIPRTPSPPPTPVRKIGGNGIKVEVFSVRPELDFLGGTSTERQNLKWDASRMMYLKEYICVLDGSRVVPHDNSCIKSHSVNIPQWTVVRTIGTEPTGDGTDSATREMLKVFPSQGMLDFRPKERLVSLAVDSSIATTDQGFVGILPIEFSNTALKECFLCIELKAKGYLSNDLVGRLLLPLSSFRRFDDKTVREEWFPLLDEDSGTVGYIHLAVSIPGGMPSQLNEAFRVEAVHMESGSRLRVTIVSASLSEFGEEGLAGQKQLFDEPPLTYVTVSALREEVVDGAKLLFQAGKARTMLHSPSFLPKYNQSFSFGAGIGSCKLLVINVKALQSFGPKTGSVLIGTVKLPLQYWLSVAVKRQEAEFLHSFAVDETFPLLGDTKPSVKRGTLRVRLEPISQWEPQSQSELTGPSLMLESLDAEDRDVEVL